MAADSSATDSDPDAAGATPDANIEGEQQASGKGDSAPEKVADQTVKGDPSARPDALNTGVQFAFELGWTMARVANDATADIPVGDVTRILPTEPELSRPARARVEVARLECLIRSIESLFSPNDEATPSSDVVALKTDLKSKDPEWDKVERDLTTLDMDVMAYLACAGSTILLAYQLGRSLYDIVSSPAQARANELHGNERAPDQDLPQTLGALMAAFGRDQIAVLQSGLATLAPHFPDESASVVKTSLGRWSEWVSAAFVPGTPGKVKGGSDERAALVDQGAQALLRQGDVWLSILVGKESLAGLLTPEARVAAAEDALSRSARIVRRVAVHYWVAIAVIVLAAAALTALAGLYLGGAGKVWTQIVTISGAIGITAKGISTRVAKLADAGEKPIYRAAEVDALAWALTTLPQANLSFRGVQALRRGGIQGSAPLGRA